MLGQWLLLIQKQEKYYYKMHDRLNAKYFSKLNGNPNGIRYKDFEKEAEIDKEIEELTKQQYTSNSSLESLAFDW